MNKPNTPEVLLHQFIDASEVIGKIAWDDYLGFGGVIEAIDEKSVTINGSVWYTQTGDSVYDSLYINGFKVYEPE